MSTATTTKRINFSLLAFPTQTRESGGTWTITAEVAQATLDAAIAAAPVAPEPATLETNAATLRTRATTALATNAAFLAVGSPTNAQTLAQVRALTRECSAVIRLLVGLLDDTAGT